MNIRAEGIILRQVKTSSGRRMVQLFTKQYGKISAGSNITERNRSKSALAMRPFTYGVYNIYKNGEFYNIDSAEVKKSFFKIGEDVDKYMYASYILELTEKLLPPEIQQPGIFNLLSEFLEAIEERKDRHMTLVIAYEMKALALAGSGPVTSTCANCGKAENLCFFSVPDGGMICRECAENIRESNSQKGNASLIYEAKFDIVNILEYFNEKPFRVFRKIALDDAVADRIQSILREYISYHMDIGKLKSESILIGKF